MTSAFCHIFGIPSKMTKKKKKKKNSKRTISIDLNSHQLFELFFEDKVVTYLCEQSKIYAASKGNFVFRVIPDEFRGF